MCLSPSTLRDAAIRHRRDAQNATRGIPLLALLAYYTQYLVLDGSPLIVDFGFDDVPQVIPPGSIWTIFGLLLLPILGNGFALRHRARPFIGDVAPLDGRDRRATTSARERQREAPERVHVDAPLAEDHDVDAEPHAVVTTSPGARCPPRARRGTRRAEPQFVTTPWSRRARRAEQREAGPPRDVGPAALVDDGQAQPQLEARPVARIAQVGADRRLAVLAEAAGVEVDVKSRARRARRPGPRPRPGTAAPARTSSRARAQKKGASPCLTHDAPAVPRVAP